MTPVAGKAVDPVCGMQVDADSPHRYAFQGREFRFCCARCRDRFSAEPGKYAQAGVQPAHGHGAENARAIEALPPPAPAEAAAPAGTIYVCPMHPQIRRPSPGTCPICGMALEPEMPSLEEERNPELESFTRRFWWTLPLSIVGVVLAMGGHRFMPLALPSMSWLELGLATPVVLWGGWPFFVRCVDSIRNRSPNMWTSDRHRRRGPPTRTGFSRLSRQNSSGRVRQAAGCCVSRGGVGHRLVDAGQQRRSLRARARTSGAIRSLLGLKPSDAASRTTGS